MSRTINGMTMREIMEKLQEDFPKKAIKTRDYDGVPYISVDDFRERLDTVIGPEHYNELYDEVTIEVTKDTLSTKTKCRLEFLDDNYEVILIKESAGGSIIAFPKVEETMVKIVDGTKETCVVRDKNNNICKVVGTTTTSIPNDLDSACQDAFKRVCRKTLGMGRRQLDVAKKGTLYHVKVRKTNPYNGMIFGELIWNNKEYKLAVFKNTADAFIKAYGSDKLKDIEISFYGEEKTDKNDNPQLVFKAPFEDDEKGNKETAKTKPIQNKKPVSDSEAQNTASNDEEKKANQSEVDQNKKPQLENQQEPKTTPEDEEKPKIVTERITITGKLTELSNSSGYYVKAKNAANDNITVVFLKQRIDIMPNWKDLETVIQKKTPFKFLATFQVNKGNYYFKETA